MVRTGIDRAVSDGLTLPGRGRVGLLCNATTVTADLVPTPEAVAAMKGLDLVRIFAPQHGFAAEKQDNMIESRDGVHPHLGVPIVSLYGERREPLPESLEGLDALVVDIQDVGTRVYTFLVSALLAMRAAARIGLPVIVLDRPNPIAGAVEGPILEQAYRSFVGIVDVPLRHGLTAGEFCIYGAWRLGLVDAGEARKIAAAARTNESTGGWLRIVPLDGWHRSLYFDATGLTWTMPSPNMPTPDTAIVYPGQVALEATNMSEGRGTTRPFEMFGAPYLDPRKVVAALNARMRDASGRDALAGMRLREIAYEPTFQKHSGHLVRGFQIHVLDRSSYRPVHSTIAILAAVRDAHPDSFAWREPPYEYEWDRLPIDLIFGTDSVRLAIDARRPLAEIFASWDAGIALFKEQSAPLLIYGG